MLATSLLCTRSGRTARSFLRWAVIFKQVILRMYERDLPLLGVVVLTKYFREHAEE